MVNMVVNLMKGMRLVETGKRQAPKTELLLTLMPSPLLQKSFLVKGVNESLQISDVTSGLVWIRDTENLVLTDTATVKTLHNVDNSEDLGEGIHTIYCKKELIYIDKDKNINKLSEDKETTTTLIKNPDPEWILWCVYCSLYSGDLLVGIYKDDKHSHDSDTVPSMVTIMFNANIGKVMRYDNTGKHTNTISHNTQTIPHNDNTPRILYRKPTYITENNNGDVVVSDSSRYAVVVTSHEGIHRFSYTGPPSVPALPIPAFNDSKFSPHGICTDVLSHILVCDSYTRTVQMLDRDGQFLSHLLTKQTPGIGYIPHSLRYDVNNHVLWVGSWDNNTVSLYRYINRHLDTREHRDVSQSSEPPNSRRIPGLTQEELNQQNKEEDIRIQEEERRKHKKNTGRRRKEARTKGKEARRRGRQEEPKRMEEEDESLSAAAGNVHDSQTKEKKGINEKKYMEFKESYFYRHFLDCSKQKTTKRKPISQNRKRKSSSG